ncbi:GNAT family N-acetyltransferase [Paenibacillus sp. P26]|nr:GNAT family N-acetyltransferase [Paenibacillus sp. P26]
MANPIEIRRMTEEDADLIFQCFTEHGIRKPMEYMRKCMEENRTGERITLLAFYDGQFAGSLHLLVTSCYPHFAANGIPEINDFNVIPPLRRLGIGSALMEAVEALALERFGIVGIGVGLYDSYGNAQRLYVRRGFIPDGRGSCTEGRPVIPGTDVCANDDLNLYFTKTRK